VRVEYPAAWGVSNPTGNITPAKDIRRGFPFEIEFTPDLAYGFKGWRAYKNPLPEGWTTDTGKLNGLERLDGMSVEVPDLTARGGTGSITINTTEDIILVPWCENEPYVIRTIPSNSPNIFYPRVTDIVIYFNSPLNMEPGEVDLFYSGAIKITGNGVDYTGRYNKPVYAVNDDFQEYTITIKPLDVPGDILIEVTVGKDIYNIVGNPMSKAEVFSFRTTSAAASGGIESWSASYNGNAIIIEWTTVGAVSDVVARYRVNKGGYNTLGGKNHAVISGVSPIDASGIRSGNPVSIHEYTISLDLSIEGEKGSVSFKTWNIPGMEITNTNTVFLNNSNFSTELTAEDSSGKNFILMESITLSGAWTPIGNGWTPFKGKFYGFGHTITLTSSMSPALDPSLKRYWGLFGYTENATIMDFTLAYAGSITGIPIETLSPPYKYNCYVGGVAGYLNNTIVRNIITTGGLLAISVPYGEAVVRIGGIAGYVEKGIIENCRAELSTSYITLESGGHKGEVCIGAVVGETGEGNSANKITTDIKGTINTENGLVGSVVELERLLINKVTVIADVSADKKENDGSLAIGGAVGKSGKNTMNDIEFIVKTISFFRYTGSSLATLDYNYCGGIIGYSVYTNVVECLFLGNIKTINDQNVYSRGSYIGGVVGYNKNLNEDNGIYYINNCRMRGGIDFSSSGASDIGGILGYIEGSSGSGKTFFILTNNFFENGKLKLTIAGLGQSYIGGIFGLTSGTINSIIINSGSYNGNITLNCNSTSAIRVGGFAAYLSLGVVSNCFSIIDINVTSIGTIYAGGFMGQSGNVNISSCYVAGTVTVTQNATSNSSYPAVGGLVGYGGGKIDNCYFLGDVAVEKDGVAYTNISYNQQYSVGGLVGFLSVGSYINNCFSKGTVSAKTNTATSTYAGGIVGYRNDGTISNTAALGTSVTVKGNGSTSDTRKAGRIYGGWNTGNLPANGNNNYALISMSIYEGTYSSSSTRSAVSLLTNNDGLNTTDVRFKERSFWDLRGLGFSDDEWLFTLVGTMGYPILRTIPLNGIPGQSAMDGQL
jgi:hypothetical protein